MFPFQTSQGEEQMRLWIFLWACGFAAAAAAVAAAAPAEQNDDQNDDPQRAVAAPTVVPTEHEYFTSLKIAPGRCPRVLYHSMAHSCPG